MNMNDYVNSLRPIAKGMVEVISNYEFEGRSLVEDLPGGKKFNFLPILLNISGKELAMYDSPDDKFDIMAQAYATMFIERADKVFAGYDPTWSKKHKAPLTGYIGRLFRRSVQEVSKAFSNYKRRHVHPKENESEDGAKDPDSFDKFLRKNSPPVKPSEEVVFKSILKALKKVMKDRSDYKENSQVLEMLLNDFSAGEIAKYFNVSAAKISQRIGKIIEDLAELAIYNKRRGDDSLYIHLDRYFDIEKGKRRANVSGLSYNRKMLSIKEINKRIDRLKSFFIF